MKVCLINSLYPPDERGGAERIVAQQAAKLREQGHSVFVLTMQKSRKYVVESVNNVKIYRLPPYNLFSFYKYNDKPLWLRLVWLAIDMVNLTVAKKVKKILLSEKPDLVQTHNLRGLSYLLPRVIKRLKLKHYHTLHDIQLIYPSGLLIRGQEKSFINTFWLRRWYEAFNKRLLGSPNKVIAPSQWLLEFHTKRGFFPKSAKEVRPPALEHKSIKLLKQELNKPVKLLYVGQVEESKGILFLLRTMKQLPPGSYQLEVIGDGSDLAKAKKIAEGNSGIMFQGYVTNERLADYYKQADITAVPSLTYENAPTVIFESLASGTPVLASQIGGIPEFIEEGINGWLFGSGSEQSLLEKMQSIFELNEQAKEKMI